MPAKKKKTSARRPAAKRATTKRASTRRPKREEIPFREEPAHEHDFTGEVPPASPFMPGMSAQCLVCPICMSLYALQQSRPEAMQHLMTAGHELFLAFRALVEAQGERWEQVNTLQRISVR
ncbi:MAG: DUF5304 family protein [Actinomycetota bacterium]